MMDTFLSNWALSQYIQDNDARSLAIDTRLVVIVALFIIALL